MSRLVRFFQPWVNAALAGLAALVGLAWITSVLRRILLPTVIRLTGRRGTMTASQSGHEVPLETDNKPAIFASPAKFAA